MTDYFQKKAFSNSQITDYLKDPLLFWERSPFNDNAKKEDPTDQMIIGTISHAVAFSSKVEEKAMSEFSTIICVDGNDLAVITGLSLATKEGKSIKEAAKNIGLPLIKLDDYNVIKEATDFFKQKFASVLKKAEFEKEYYATVTLNNGATVDLKCKIDMIVCEKNGHINIYDYKTTYDISTWLGSYKPHLSRLDDRAVKQPNGERLTRGFAWVQALLYRYIVSLSTGVSMEKIWFTFVFQSIKEGQANRMDSVCVLSQESDPVALSITNDKSNYEPKKGMRYLFSVIEDMINVVNSGGPDNVDFLAKEFGKMKGVFVDEDGNVFEDDTESGSLGASVVLY